MRTTDTSTASEALSSLSGDGSGGSYKSSFLHLIFGRDLGTHGRSTRRHSYLTALTTENVTYGMYMY